MNTEKAAAILLDDFRSGKLGRISLERPTVIIKEIHKAGREDRERQNRKKTAGGKCEEKRAEAAKE